MFIGCTASRMARTISDAAPPMVGGGEGDGDEVVAWQCGVHPVARESAFTTKPLHEGVAVTRPWVVVTQGPENDVVSSLVPGEVRRGGEIRFQIIHE